MKRALLYIGLLAILSAIFILHNHIISAPQPTSRGIGLIIIGAALGITATLFQGYFKNNLADSGLMGLTTGAALGSIISLRIGNEFGSRAGIMISVFFAFITFYLFDYIKNKFFVNGLLLTFILSTPILFLAKNSQHDSTFWLLGSFTELNKHHVKVFAPFVEVGIITSFFIARKILNKSNAVKLFVASGSAFLIGPWVNVTGAILGFGIFIPFITKLLIKGDTRRVLSYAALIGPIILIILDVLINKLNDISVSAITLAFSLLLSLFGKKQAQRQS